MKFSHDGEAQVTIGVLEDSKKKIEQLPTTLEAFFVPYPEI